MWENKFINYFFGGEEQKKQELRQLSLNTYKKKSSEESTLSVKFRVSRVKRGGSSNGRMDGRISTSDLLEQGSREGEVASQGGGDDVVVKLNLVELILATLKTQRNLVMGNKLKPFKMYDLIALMKETIACDDEGDEATLTMLHNPDIAAFEKAVARIPEIFYDEVGKVYHWIPKEDQLNANARKYAGATRTNRFESIMENWSKNIKSSIDEGLLEVEVAKIKPCDLLLVSKLQIPAGKGETPGREVYEVSLKPESVLVNFCKILDGRGHALTLRIEHPERSFRPLLDVCKVGANVIELKFQSDIHPKYLKGALYYDISDAYETSSAVQGKPSK